MSVIETKLEDQEVLRAPLTLDEFPDIEIVGIREGGLIDCWVPTDYIDHEEVPVKEEWVNSLLKEMDQITEVTGGTGQLSPIILGRIEGEPKLRIIDGFHRDAALAKKGEERVYSTIKATDWDGLFDLRIFTAKDHAHVRFSRVVQWIQEVWNFSGLADKMSVEQAVLLYRFDTSGKNLGLAHDEAEAAKAWVARKEGQWQMKAMTIHSHLKVAENVDPVLVHSTRDKDNGNVLTAPTQVILKHFSSILPNRFELQHLVMEAAKLHNLKGPQVRALCTKVAEFEDLDDAEAFMANVTRETWQPEYSETKKRNLRRAYDPRHKGSLVLASAQNDIDNIAQRLEQTIVNGEPVTPEMRLKLLDAQNGLEAVTRQLGNLGLRLAELIEQEVVLPEAERHIRRHESWGLKFKAYEGELAPSVHIDGRRIFDSDDLTAAILFAIAKQKPGEVLSVDQVQSLLCEEGFDPSNNAHASKIRAAMNKIDVGLTERRKQSHVILRSAGHRNLLLGLIDEFPARRKPS